MKKRSLFLIAGILLVASLPLYFWNFYNSTKDYFDRDVTHRKRIVAAYLDLAKGMIETHQESRLTNILKEAVDLNMFDWYLISSDKKLMDCYPSRHCNIPILELPAFYEEKTDYDRAVNQLPNGSYLAIGINKNWFDYYAEIESRFIRWKVIFECISLLTILGIFAYLLRDILRPLQLLRAGRANEAISYVRSHQANTREGQLFAQILEGYHKSLTSLEEQRSIMAQQILPSLRSELRSGKQPPYEFDCTLVRIDINRYSEMFISGHRSELMSVVRDLFTDASKIVASYGGYVHEFVGDELIYYFKDEEHTESFSMAVACILDIQESCDKYLPEIRKLFNCPLTIKSSLARGTLRYDRHVQGFSLVGAAFIESVRILSLIEERDRHQIYFPENAKPQLLPIFSATKKGDFKLKGYQEETGIFEVVAKVSLSDRWRQPAGSLARDLCCYRHPSDLKAILDFLASSPPDETGPYLQILSNLSAVFLADAHPELRDATIHLIECRLKDAPNSRFLPQSVRLLKTFVHPEVRNQSVDDLLKRVLSAGNDRASANAVEIFANLNLGSAKELYIDFREKTSSRTIGNILVYWSHSGLGPELIAAFDEQISRSDGLRLASITHAFTAILRTWKARDLVYVKAQSEFLAIGNKILHCAKSLESNSENNLASHLSVMQEQLGDL